MLVTEAVVEETARHAMKAYTDYRVRVTPSQRPLAWWEIADLESAFTREFEYLRTEGKVKPGQWSKYISRYAGPENYRRKRYTPDTSKMRSIVNAEGFGICAPEKRDKRWRRRQDAIEKVIYEESRKRHPDERRDVMKDKARIDAEMLMTVDDVVAGAQGQGAGERYLIISSATRLRELPKGVAGHLRDIPMVISLAEAAGIAALLPEQPIALRALHAFLFEDRIGRTLGGLEGTLLRIVREASSVALPGATRGVADSRTAPWGVRVRPRGHVLAPAGRARHPGRARREVVLDEGSRRRGDGRDATAVPSPPRAVSARRPPASADDQQQQQRRRDRAEHRQSRHRRQVRDDRELHRRRARVAAPSYAPPAAPAGGADDLVATRRLDPEVARTMAAEVLDGVDRCELNFRHPVRDGRRGLRSLVAVKPRAARTSW